MKPQHQPLKFLRYRNSRGGVIPMHHAFKTIELGSVSRMSALLLPVLFVAIIWLFLPMILDLWDGVLSFWMRHLYHGQVAYSPQVLLGQDVYVPYPLLEAETPSRFAVWANLIICVLVFLVSFLLPRRAMPITYLFRTLMLIQSSASIDRLVSPQFFPYTLQLYLVDSIMNGVYILIMMPPLLGLVYYIFNFSLSRKIGLTCMIIGYYLLFLPCHYMLHAYLIHEYTLLFLPILYIFFGTLLEVLMFVCIYSYGMSWRSNVEAMQGRGV